MRTLCASNLLQEINWQEKNEKAGIAHLNMCTAAVSKFISYLMNILSSDAVMKFNYPGSTHENVKREMARNIQKKTESRELNFFKFFQIFFVLLEFFG